ncbi:hypothetical protein F5Y17DRAFT_439438 [Xylariaceae sp. FL0594]|nr:hypothetical protein F5Y17DRAFT_439438 [Xylariaceae sp. FL0594]
MDYTHAYFPGTPFQFMGVPPLTPSHSNSATSDEFGHNAHSRSPNELYEPFPSHDQYSQPFDPYAPPFNHQNQAYPGPPGPPTPPNLPMQGQSNAVLNGGLALKTGQADVLSLTKHDPDAHRQTGGSNSEEDEVSPAQSRRKAQNRAAQRAFRERKEKHVKDLEAKLASLEAAQSATASENEKLKREMQKISTENKILRATSTVQAQQNGAMSPVAGIAIGPMQYTPTDFFSNLLQNHENKNPSHRIVESGGERLLAAGAAWDYIIGHDLFKAGHVDLEGVSERLKYQAKCDGQGPVFEERAVLKAIEDSVASGSDELL